MISFQLRLEKLKGRSDFFKKLSAISSQFSNDKADG